MNNKTKIILAGIALLLLSGGIFAFLKLRSIKAPQRDLLEAMPGGAFCIIESTDIDKTQEKITHGNLVWEAFLGTDWGKHTGNCFSEADSLLNADNDFKEFLKERKGLISLHATGKEHPDFFIAIEAGKNTDLSGLLRKIRNHPVIRESKRAGAAIYQYSNFFAGVKDGIFLASSQEELLKSSIDQLDRQDSVIADKDFLEVRKTAGNSAVANIYIHYSRLSAALKKISDENFLNRLEDLSSFAGWTELDLSVRPNALLLNGYTTAYDSAGHFLSVFKGQQSQSLEADQVLPASTLSYVSLGVSNFNLLMERYDLVLDKTKNNSNRREMLAQLKTNHGFTPNETIGEWTGNEITYAEILHNGKAEPLALISTTDTEKAKTQLQKLMNDSAMVSADSAVNPILKIPFPDMLPATFGELFNSIHDTWYTIYRHYVVFAGNEDVLHAFIADNENKKTLRKDPVFADFISNISAEAGITAYNAVPMLQRILKGRASAEFLEKVNQKDTLINRFDGVVIQYTAGNNNLYYTNAFLRHNPQTKKQISTLWEFETDTTFSGKPWLVLNHNTKELDIFIQDDANTVYLLSNTGTLYWKRKVDGKIMGDVSQVDAFKNDKLQIAFNTASKVYVIDRNGNDLEHFPITLPAEASAPMRVMDYDNNRDYRLIIPCKDRKVYNYDITAKRVEGWSFKGTDDIVIAPVMHVALSGKDFVIIAEKSGKVHFTDRQGKSRMELPEKLGEPVKAVFIEAGKDPARTKVVSCDSLGNITKLSFTGELERTRFTGLQHVLHFEYTDLNGDGNQEYVFLDNRKLSIFNKDKQNEATYPFASNVFNRFSLYRFGEQDTRIGLVFPDAAELHLINKGGEDSEGFPIPGKTLFSIGRLNGSGGLTLVCGMNDKYVAAYPVR